MNANQDKWASFFKAFFISLVLLITAFTGIGSILPQNYQITAERTLDAPVDQVRNKILHLSTWKDWNPFFRDLQDVDFEFGSNLEGFPFIKWQEVEQKNIGRLDIIDVPSDEQVQTNLRVYQPYDVSSDGLWTLMDKGGQTHVTWSYSGTVDGLVTKWYAFLLKGSMRNDLEEALAKLEQAVQAQPAPAFEMPGSDQAEMPMQESSDNPSANPESEINAAPIDDDSM